MSLRRFAIVSICVSSCASAVVGCGGSGTTTVIERTATVPSTPAASDVGSQSAAGSGSTASQPHARPHIFRGSVQQDLGTINIPSDTTISWNCPSCTSTNFIVNNANSDDNNIPTNGLDQTHGVDLLPAGTYHTVAVDTTGGPWTVAIGGTAPDPGPGASAASYSASPSSSPSGSASPSPSPASQSTQCDPNISVSGADCSFAENAFYEYWNHHGASNFSVYSPSDGSTKDVTCSNSGDITCSSPDGASATFTQSAIDGYSQAQADSYAHSHRLS